MEEPTKKKTNKITGKTEGFCLDDLLDSDSTSPTHDTSLDNLFGSNEDVANKEESSKMDYGKESKESVEEKSKDDLRKERNEARKKKKQEARAKIDAAKANSTSQSGQSLDDLFGDGETNANEKQ